MNQTLFFYDLETSGFSPKTARIMQFAGQRTDLDLNPIEPPHNYLIKMTEDVLPDPGAVLVTGITPQQTLVDGLAEAEFLKLFSSEIAQPGTVFVGFNSVRFDDEFMRFLHYRNFYDPYEWQWQHDRSRWDLLDLVRMTRALRPDGIKWPFDSSGMPANRLELLASVNKIKHASAHDALSDVEASIGLARLIKNKQPKLFSFLLKMRDKREVEKFVRESDPFVYTSGKYDSEYEKTTIAGVLAKHPNQPASLVFDLRHDPGQFEKLSVKELAEAWRCRYDEPGLKLPVKTLKYNRCPAVAPLSVLDEASQKRLQLDLKQIKVNHESLNKGGLKSKVLKALEILDKKQQAKLVEDELDVDARLYDGFFSEQDKTKMSVIRANSTEELKKTVVKFNDERLNSLIPLYKARNYPETLTTEERAAWETFKTGKLLGSKNSFEDYFTSIEAIASSRSLSDKDKYIIEELRLYGQSVMPAAAG